MRAACNLGRDDERDHPRQRARHLRLGVGAAHPVRFSACRARRAARGRGGLGPLRPGERLGACPPRGSRDRRGEADRAGGLLMYGIPNMKLPRTWWSAAWRSCASWAIEFWLETDAARPDVAEGLRQTSTPWWWPRSPVPRAGSAPRALPREPGRQRRGLCRGLPPRHDQGGACRRRAPLHRAVGKDVVVIGGGDTGNDCLGTAVRQGAGSVPAGVHALRARVPAAGNAWPQWPNVKTDYGQQEAIALMGPEMSGPGHPRVSCGRVWLRERASAS